MSLILEGRGQVSVKTEVYNSDYISSLVTEEGQRGRDDKLTMSNVSEVRVGKRIGFSLCAAPLHQYRSSISEGQSEVSSERDKG